MNQCRGSVAIGPSAGDSGRARHLGVFGQLLTSAGGDVTDPGVWLFTSLPVREDSMIATFRLRGDAVSAADVVRVGTALALYTEPQVGDIGGAVLELLGQVDAYDVTVTPEIAATAHPISTWDMTVIVTGEPDLEPLAVGLADGGWDVHFAPVGAGSWARGGVEIAG
ncbi:hypothetical protein [Mobilicoccus caccae]|uniref:Uncharacterized protein n=1 Tax=Mobilicoccus caccae TaxID=1859295 RepID=A0ABQ6IY69_9MICO|nr:hypothetical protein [Mobilicoccus caccae]GMA42016.1 hypothetical protein GCM10025883_40610 [Mobilicoccus caccae]